MKKALIGLGVVGTSLIVTGVALAQEDPAPIPRTSVGIVIDSKDGLTESTINCMTEGQDGRHSTVNGDGSLFMENRTPHVIRCTIHIRED